VVEKQEIERSFHLLPAGELSGSWKELQRKEETEPYNKTTAPNNISTGSR